MIPGIDTPGRRVRWREHGQCQFEWLKVRAAQHERSLEAEARAVFAEAWECEKKVDNSLGAACRELLKDTEGFDDIPIPPRTGSREAGGLLRVIILDTDVVAERFRPLPDERVGQWFDTVDRAETALTSITIGELRAGIARTPQGESELSWSGW